MDAFMMKLAREHGCQTCAAFAPRRTVDGDVASTFGSCRLAPPRTSSQTPWPTVAFTDFCGEYHPRDEGVLSTTGKLVIGRAL